MGGRRKLQDGDGVGLQNSSPGWAGTWSRQVQNPGWSSHYLCLSFSLCVHCQFYFFPSSIPSVIFFHRSLFFSTYCFACCLLSLGHYCLLQELLLLLVVTFCLVGFVWGTFLQLSFLYDWRHILCHQVDVHAQYQGLILSCFSTLTNIILTFLLMASVLIMAWILNVSHMLIIQSRAVLKYGDMKMNLTGRRFTKGVLRRWRQPRFQDYSMLSDGHDQGISPMSCASMNNPIPSSYDGLHPLYAVPVMQNKTFFPCFSWIFITATSKATDTIPDLVFCIHF